MKILILGSAVLLLYCRQIPLNVHAVNDLESKGKLAYDSNENILSERYNCPDSFYRKGYDSSTFAWYLSHLKLKPMLERVRYYNGSYKPAEAYSSVVDMEISPVDLQQCADAVMRLRGEYLYNSRQYDKIAFKFLGDDKWHHYLDYVGSDRSYKKFRKYMDYVFSYANTGSLHKQLKPKRFSDMQIGDVFVQKGQPYGHAVIVVDVCYNARGEKKFLLAQSYMPAQETQILRNPGSSDSWYAKPEGKKLYTPEWTFDTTDLRTW